MGTEHPQGEVPGYEEAYLYARGGFVTSEPEKIFGDAETTLPANHVDDMVHSPSHYVFPGGVEVKHLSQHLTSMGGQAVQYIARATRLDGNVKGNPIEDIDKAIEVLQIERERLSRGV